MPVLPALPACTCVVCKCTWQFQVAGYIVPTLLRDIIPMFLRDIVPTFLRDIVPRSFREARERNAVKHALSGVLLHSGLRAGECADLRVQDLDLPGKRLIVRQGAA